MANSRFKCTGCKEYFSQSLKISTGQGNFCSRKCINEKRTKRQRTDFKKSKERKSGAPTVEQERAWLDQIQQFVFQHGAFPKGRRGRYWQHHHLFGRKARHNRQEIGRWAVLPIELKYHAPESNEPTNITHFPNNYIEAYGSDVNQFLLMCETIQQEQGRLEIPQDILLTITELV